MNDNRTEVNEKTTRPWTFSPGDSHMIPRTFLAVVDSVDRFPENRPQIFVCLLMLLEFGALTPTPGIQMLITQLILASCNS